LYGNTRFPKSLFQLASGSHRFITFPKPDGIEPFWVSLNFGLQLALPFLNNPPLLFLS
jgi:hypothetical protein